MASKSKVKKSKRKKKQKVYEENLFESDDIFAFIADYTSGGAPYGITWEEMEEIEHRDEGFFGGENNCYKQDETDLPFD